MVRPPSGGGDDEGRALGELGLAEPHLHAERGELGRGRPLPLPVVPLEHDDALSPPRQRPGGGEAGDPQSGDDDAHYFGIHST